MIRSTRLFALGLVALAGSSTVVPIAYAGVRSLPAATLLDEVRRSFTIGGEPIPPEIFRDFGDGDLADSGPIIVAIDVRAAVGSNLYADEIKRGGAWVSQGKAASKAREAEETSYRFIGTTSNKLLVAVASYNGGGSGTFYTLHILDAQVKRAFDFDGKPYDRIDVSTLRSKALGDRWNGDVALQGNTIVIMTRSRGPADHGQPERKVIAAERP